MIRSVKIKLEITKSKRRQLLAVYSRFRSIVNKYFQRFYWKPTSLNKITKALVPCGHVSDRYRSLALQQALAIKSATRERMKKKKHKIPYLKGAINLADGVAQIQKSIDSQFDYWIKFSTLTKGDPIYVPFKSHKILNKYLTLGGKIKSGLKLTKDCQFVILVIELPNLPNKEGIKLGLDIGFNKLLSTSDCKIYGKDIKILCGKVDKRKSGSKGKKRARIERDNYIGQICNQLPWNDLSLLVIEDLKNLKFGKRVSKSFRKKLSAWTYPLVKQRLTEKANLNRVQVAVVNPAYTSVTCPKCNNVDKFNRSNEVFCCCACGYSGDCDIIASGNILNRYLGSLQSPSFTKKKKVDIYL